MAAQAVPSEYALWHGVIPDRQGRRRYCQPGRELVRGDGIRVQDRDGNSFIDARSSLRTVTLGYGHSGVVQAVRSQLERLPFAEVIRHDRPSDVAIEYGERLVAALGHGFRRVRFGTSGSRMVEEAVVLSRFIRVSGERTPQRTAVIANVGAWHGTGGIASAVSGDARLWKLAGPLDRDIHHVPVDDIAALERLLSELGEERVTAIVLEPVFGTQGLFPSAAYLRAVAALCSERGLHLIVDEITSGAGRMGALAYAFEIGIVPDVLLLGKGLTSGYVPIAALAAREGIYEAAMKAMPVALPHASTNDAHPLAMAAGIAVLDALADGSIYENVRTTGAYLGRLLDDLKRQSASVVSHTGEGFLHFLRVERDGVPWNLEAVLSLTEECEARGLLIDRLGNLLIVAPPLVTTAGECDDIVERLGAAITATAAKPAEAVVA